jgi:hypothetical protein
VNSGLKGTTDIRFDRPTFPRVRWRHRRSREPTRPALRCTGWNGTRWASPVRLVFGVPTRPSAFGAPELVDLELDLMTRTAGMVMEAPAVPPGWRET